MTGPPDEMLHDSIWSTMDKAKAYVRKNKKALWSPDIIEVEVDKESIS